MSRGCSTCSKEPFEQSRYFMSAGISFLFQVLNENGLTVYMNTEVPFEDSEDRSNVCSLYSPRKFSNFRLIL